MPIRSRTDADGRTDIQTPPASPRREDERAAASVLGPEHALARLLARRRALTVQIAVTSMSVVLAAVGTMLAVNSAPVVLGAALVVEVALLVMIPFICSRTHEVTYSLLADGDDDTLRDPRASERSAGAFVGRERERLARSLETPAARGGALEPPAPGAPHAPRRPHAPLPAGERHVR